ncbi:hypothetical protein BGZ95_003809 [Linnemannia exigua]|uniref:AMP-activated protein kinase glycogen-binding domain-containing protein n=1 Tax=Linnemannia exigua TaxID=604196 RepID=A0AAD4D479_9FUNG|nr:hypothetical protein BGZ95_003809 [Linnemannia exigua]
MVTTQIQVLLYVGSRQLVSCSFFVPVPPIVVKSQQRLESILPYLPIPPSLCSALTFSTEPNDDHLLSDDPQRCSAVVYKGNNNNTKRDYYYKSSQSNYYYSSSNNDTKSVALIKSSSLDSSATLTSSATTTALQRYEDPFDYATTTTCIKISLNPKATFRFLRLRFFRKQNEGFRDDYYFRQHPSYTNGGKKYDASSRTTPVLFTFPFPSYDEHFPSTVQVTGTFDDWQRDAPLLIKNEEEGRFEAEILVDLERLPEVYQEEEEDIDSISCGTNSAAAAVAGEAELPAGAKLRRKLIYKFVLGGQQWVTDAGQSLERDHEGNLNNIRFLEDVTVEERKAEQQWQQDEVKAKDTGKTRTEEEIVETLVLKEVKQTTLGDDAINASPAGENVAPLVPTYNTGAVVAEAVHASTGELTRKRRSRLFSTSMISINGEDDEREHDGDYGVAIVQGDPVTVSTTAMTSLTFFGDHRSAAMERSIRMIMSSVDNMSPSDSSDTMIHDSTSSDCDTAAPSILSEDSPTSSRRASTVLADDSILPTHNNNNSSDGNHSSNLPLSTTVVSSNSLPSSIGSKSTILPIVMYSGDTTARDFMVQAVQPTTAVTTLAPQLPSMTSIALSTKKKTTGFWKKIKKVLA